MPWKPVAQDRRDRLLTDLWAVHVYLQMTTERHHQRAAEVRFASRRIRRETAKTIRTARALRTLLGARLSLELEAPIELWKRTA